MSFAEHTCISATCDTCKKQYPDDDTQILHFDSRDEAVAALMDSDWNCDGDRFECHDCAAKRACDESGHLWTPWRACRCGCANGTPRIPVHTQPVESRHCERCIRFDDDRPVVNQAGGEPT